MTKIGNNEFFATQRGAKAAATRRGYVDGARIFNTSAGYCLLKMGEGVDEESYRIVSQAESVIALHIGKWWPF